MQRIAFTTLGCKINQFDTAEMQSSCKPSDGYTIVAFDVEADVYVINTCTVTGKSDAESRRIVRKALKRNSSAQIIVTGCYAQTNPDEIAGIPGVSVVLGNNEKQMLKEYLRRNDDASLSLGQNVHVSDIFNTSSLHISNVAGYQNKTRAILKIQDGCDSRCAYCIVPFARGSSRSLPPDDVIKQVISLCGNGYKEIVLSGVHLGGYGRDLSLRSSLANVVRRILSDTDIKRVRLSSIEPREITDELIELMASEDRICRHLHIPLQSGDDYILHRMNRNYDSEFYADLILRVSKMIEGAGIGCDVMVGYPGEGDDHFNNTYRFIENLPFTYLHVFAYSPREGTSAYLMNDTVQGNIKENRSRMLRNLGEEKSCHFKNIYIGKTVDVLVEEERDAETGALIGYTGNYLRVLIERRHQEIMDEKSARNVINKIAKVTITGLTGGKLSGRLCG